MVVSININRLNSVKKSTVFYWSWESIKCIYMFPPVITVSFHINRFIFVRECDVFTEG